MKFLIVLAALLAIAYARCGGSCDCDCDDCYRPPYYLNEPHVPIAVPLLAPALGLRPLGTFVTGSSWYKRK
uniref:Secreted protein n=1 Tax=Syphacia muris TaxID=451379 RepID=A0A0N5AJ13_9BILA